MWLVKNYYFLNNSLNGKMFFKTVLPKITCKNLNKKNQFLYALKVDKETCTVLNFLYPWKLRDSEPKIIQLRVFGNVKKNNLGWGSTVKIVNKI